MEQFGGVSLEIFALTNPHEKTVQRQVDQVRAPVHYLEEAVQPRRVKTLWKEHIQVASRHFRGYIRSLFYVAANRKIDQGYTAGNRWECFLQAVSFVHLLMIREQRTGRRLDHLHAHFAHDPTLIAYLVHRMTGIPFSFTAHARDLYQVPEKTLLDRIREASAVITCCRANLDYLNQIAPSQQSKFLMVYHGVNLKDFPPASNTGTGSISTSPVILSVGRLVEKKGFYDLLQALLKVKEKGSSMALK